MKWSKMCSHETAKLIPYQDDRLHMPCSYFGYFYSSCAMNAVENVDVLNEDVFTHDSDRKWIPYRDDGQHMLCSHDGYLIANLQ